MNELMLQAPRLHGNSADAPHKSGAFIDYIGEGVNDFFVRGQ